MAKGLQKCITFAACICVVASAPVMAAPVVTSITPAQAYNYQATSLTVQGTGFQSGATVKLGAISLTTVQFVNATTMTASAPAGLLPGAYTVTVTNPDAQSGSLTNGFTVSASRSGLPGTSRSLAAPPCPAPTESWLGRQLTAWNTFVYCFDSSGNLQRGAVSGDGSIQWQAVSPSPLAPTSVPAGTFPQLLAIVSSGGNSFVWAAKTCSGSFPGTCDLAYAALAVDGSIGAWGSGQVILNARLSHLRARDGYLYIFNADEDQPGNNVFGKVVRIPVGVDGSPGTRAIVGPRSNETFHADGTQWAIIQDYAHTFTSPSNSYTNIERAHFNDDGTVSDWTLLPSNQLPFNGALSVVVADSHLYVTGQYQVCANPPFCTIEGRRASTTAIFSDGSLGSWQQLSAPFPDDAVAVTSAARTWVIGRTSEVELSPMTVTSVAPSSGPAEGCTRVTIAGTDLLPGQVTFGGVPGTSLSSNGFQSLTVRTPAHGVGSVDVTVTNLDGRSVTFANGFTYANIARLSTSPAALHFSVVNSNGTLSPATQVLQVLPATECASVTWTAAPSSPWIYLSATGATGAQAFSVSIVNNGPFPSTGTLNGSINLTDSANQRVLSVSITVDVHAPGTTAAPFGHFDAPTDQTSGITGAIPITGWALDDVGVNRVEIWRNCVESIDRQVGACTNAPGEAANFVFVGLASFLSGARPDVEAQFGGWPQSYRAGWGSLVLTLGFPHLDNPSPYGGQGSFTVSSYAIDEEGHSALLGRKTISVDNDHATIPFGNLDTPAQGAIVPGPAFPFNEPNAYPVFGWAMTQAGKCIDTTSTASYRVYIDGVQQTLVPGTNWFPGLNRSDLAAAFPGLCNSTDGLAAYYMDVRPLTNGLHTIGWDVIDDQGKVAGIGSRVFTVLK